MKRKFLFLIPVFVIILACVIYICDYYHASDTALAAMDSTAQVTVTEDGNTVIFSPALPEAGFIFYPGGKVDHTAYAPLMAALAQKNIFCVLIKMPVRLAVLNPDAGEDIPARYPDITTWYIGGHSLGGSMAASCASDNPELFEGLVFLAAYSTADLSQTNLEVLTIYGSADGVMNMEKYQEYYENLPESTQEIIIRGGNHAYFGSYGIQKEDGIAGITSAEQISLTAAYLATFFT